MRHAGDLFCGHVFIAVFGEQVHSRSLHILIETHTLADTAGLYLDTGLLKKVSGVEHIVFLTPFADALAEGAGKEFGAEIVEVVADFAESLFARKHEELRKFIQYAVSETLLEFFRKRICPLDTVSIDSGHLAVIGFVGKYSRNGFAEFVGDLAAVGFVSDLDELIDGFGIQGVKIGFSVVP